jgi:hypothetical protein
VPAGALALSRSPQIDRPGYADKVALRYAALANGAAKGAPKAVKAVTKAAARTVRKPATAKRAAPRMGKANAGKAKTKPSRR